MVEVLNTETYLGDDEEIEEVLGVARGNTVKARNVARDWTQGIRNMLGGELKGYTELFTDTREEAVQQMKDDAKSMGADAVVNMRFDTSSISQNSAEVVAYGTAVKLASSGEDEELDY